MLQMIDSFGKACGKDLPYQIDPRRPGDIAECYACVDKANAELDWKADRNIEDMCRDQWKWQQNSK